MKSQKFIAILSLALVLTPFVIFPVCENLKPDGSHMGCWYSGIFITSMGILIFIFAFLALMKKFPVIFSILSGAAAVICWLVPNRIFEIPPCSLCGDFSHACRACGWRNMYFDSCA